MDRARTLLRTIGLIAFVLAAIAVWNDVITIQVAGAVLAAIFGAMIMLDYIRRRM